MTTKELEGITHELAFWKRFVQSPHFKNDWDSDTHNNELVNDQREVYDFFLARPEARVLDVGSGVMPILRGIVSRHLLVATDPLAGLYELIFDYAKSGYPPPSAIPAEELRYDEEFDIVHIRNAFDHTQDPVAVYANLLKAVKPGGHVIIHGFENEALFENWQGFHQWNVSIDDHECLRIEGKNPLTDYLMRNQGGIALSKQISSGKKWYIWIQQKQ
jgi:SAM-dependent methyltransferase